MAAALAAIGPLSSPSLVPPLRVKFSSFCPFHGGFTVGSLNFCLLLGYLMWNNVWHSWLVLRVCDIWILLSYLFKNAFLLVWMRWWSLGDYEFSFFFMYLFEFEFLSEDFFKVFVLMLMRWWWNFLLRFSLTYEFLFLGGWFLIWSKAWDSWLLLWISVRFFVWLLLGVLGVGFRNFFF